MPDIQQQTFLGASIRRFNFSLGWNGQQSTLAVDTVEDNDNDDLMLTAVEGQPAYFSYGAFTFGGIIQKIVTQGSFDGNPVFQTILNDPREILDGVQLILNNYTGSIFSTPNLYNIYGYWENTIGFGTSQVNEAGIPWQKVRDAFLVLQRTTPIKFGDNNYTIDLTMLPSLPIYYRVGGGTTSISLAEFIAQLCDDAVYDYFFNLETNNVIRLYTVSRRDQPSLGLISSFIENTDGAVSKEVGLELRNDTTSKFLVGGKQSNLLFQTWQAAEEESDDPIQQYYGLDKFGNVILPVQKQHIDNNTGAPVLDDTGQPYPPYWAVELDARAVEVWGLGEVYETDSDELRAVLAGIDNWTEFLISNHGNYATPHANKVSRLNILGLVDKERLARFFGTGDISSLDGWTVMDISPFRGKLVKDISESLGRTHGENIAILYNFLRDYADRFYGKKYMIRIPDISVARDSETLEIKTTLEPIEEGFLDSHFWASGVALNYLPPDFTKLQVPDGRFYPYVRYNSAYLFDVSELSPDDYALGANFVQKRKPNNFSDLSLFIRCSVDPKIVYTNIQALTSPRAIVTLPGRVSTLADNPGFIDTIRDAGSGILSPRTTFDKLYRYRYFKATDDAKYNKILSRIASEHIYFGNVGISWEPDLAAVPLLSNVATYGPWYVAGANGRTEFEHDDSLVPWNFGGFDLLNSAANAKVQECLSNQTLAENGIIEVPGAPEVNAGEVLIAGGPYVTGVDVNIGSDGIKTLYRMETWTARFGRVAKQAVDRVQRMRRAIRDQRRNFIEWTRQFSPAFFHPKRPDYNYSTFSVPRNRKPSTSSPYILAQNVFNSGTRTYKTVVTVSPMYNVPAMLGGPEYSGKALVSLDGLFQPYSTSKTDFWNLPHFETPTASGGTNRSVDELNPYPSGHNVYTIAQSSGIPDDVHLNDMEDSWKRPVGFKTPMVLVGWGYDTAGKPVPNSSSGTPTNNFATNYLQRPDLWKAGPLDVRWSNTRKVWETGGGTVRVAKIMSDLYGGGSCSGHLVSNLDTKALETERIRIRDVLGDGYGRYVVIPSGYFAIVMPEATSSDYLIMGAQPR